MVYVRANKDEERVSQALTQSAIIGREVFNQVKEQCGEEEELRYNY